MRFLLPAVLFSFSINAHAQKIFSTDDEHIFHAGIAAGANFCQVDGDGFVGYHKVGFAGNAQVYVRLSRVFQLSLGLGYAQKGSRESDIRQTSLGPAVFRYRLDLNYAEMPLMLYLFDGTRINYGLGISYGRLISSKEEAEDINPIRIDPELYPFRKDDWTGIAHIGYHIYGQWFATAQFQYTLGSIRNLDAIPPGYGYARERNNAVAVRLLYIIPSGGAR